jgi:signal recognition particle receptor subunit beta
MAGLVEPHAQPLVTDALDKLSRMACRITVVGQIKSGKSTFINAFVRQPNLLPTAVTPWTTAITNLHFRQTPPGRCAASFTFMQRGEWDQIAMGAGKIRELTERLVPDFEPELLQRQATALAVRAREKLGPEFEQLLGRSHVFESLAPGTLEHYICSGEFTGLSSVGKYSDITSSADLYFQQGPFEFPATVTDTPGVNDPFLLRDEITRRNLGAADVYIVVLTARQPLSDQDVALLRVMRGLNKDRIVVLINRIDDFTDIEEDLPQVASFVRKRLADEFPGSSIPVACGSGWWAAQSLAFDPEAVARILRRPSAAHLCRGGILQREDLDPVVLGDPDTRARIAQALYAMSGMPAVYEAIETMTGLAQPAFSMSHIARGFTEMSRACESAARSELQILLANQASMGTPVAPSVFMPIYTQERDLLMQVAANIDASAEAIEAQLVRIIQEEQKRLRSSLGATIEAYAARERDVLVDTLSRGRTPRVWTHEGGELRRALLNDFRQGFQTSTNRLLAFHTRFVPELHKLLQSLVPTPDLAAPQSETLAIPMPTTIPLSRMLVLDLDHSKWGVFWNRNASATNAGDKIEALIRTEFAQVADELVDAAGRTFHDFGRTTMNWALGACRNIQQALKRRLEHLLAEQQIHASAMDRITAAREIGERIKVQAQRLKDNEALTQHLEHLARHIDSILKSEARKP